MEIINVAKDKCNLRIEGQFFSALSQQIKDAFCLIMTCLFPFTADLYIPPNKRVEHNNGASHVITASLPIMLLVLLLSS